MAINFPASPSVNETFTEGSITYKCLQNNPTKWIGLGVTPADRLVEGSNNLEINSSNNLIWTGGSVGIGTSSPAFPSGSGIEITSTQNPRLKLSNTATGGSATDGTQLYLSSDGETILDNKDNKNIRFDAGGSQRLTISATDGELHVTGGVLKLGTADSSSAHLNSFEVMTFNIDTDNDDTNRYFAFYKDGASGSGTELFKIDESGNATVQGQVVTPNTSGSLAARNRIDNGAMEVAQRGGSETTIDSSTSEYVCDRWAARAEPGDAFLYDQDNSAPYGFKNSLKFNCSNTSGGGSNQLYTISQAIEGYNIADFGFGGGSARGMSISFWVKASITGDWGGSVQNSDRDRSYPFVYNIAVADEWEYKTVYIPGPTSGSWNNTNGIGIRLNFDMGCGSGFRGNAGSWNNADDRGPSGAISPMQTLNSVWRVTGVQLEMGPAATPFEYRGYPIELVRCKRYYQRIGYGNHLCITNAINNNAARIPIPIFPVEMRAQPAYTAPTLTEFSAGTAITPSSTHQPSKNGGGYIQLPSSPTNGMYLKLIANAELT